MSTLASQIAPVAQGAARRKSRRIAKTAAVAVFAALALAGFFFPQITGSSFYAGVAVQGVIIAIGAVAVAFLLHQCGLAMFGIAAATGGAAYLVAVAATSLGWSIGAAVLGSLALMVLLSAGIGFLVVRSGHLQFAMITLALGQMLHQLVQLTALRPLTGGDDGIIVSFSGSFLGYTPAQLADPVAFWPIAWGALCLVVLLTRWAAGSRLGVLLRAIQDNEERMRFSGYNTLLPRLAAFVLAVFVASIAGVLTTLHLAFVSPQLLDFSTGGLTLTAALVGGISTVVGPAIGGLLFGFANDLFSASGYLELLTGLAIVIAMGVFPDNRRSLRYWMRRFKADSGGDRDAQH